MSAEPQQPDLLAVSSIDDPVFVAEVLAELNAGSWVVREGDSDLFTTRSGRVLNSDAVERLVTDGLLIPVTEHSYAGNASADFWGDLLYLRTSDDPIHRDAADGGYEMNWSW